MHRQGSKDGVRHEVCVCVCVHVLACKHTHTHTTHTNTHTHTHTRTYARTHTHTRTLSLSLSLSHTHTYTQVLHAVLDGSGQVKFAHLANRIVPACVLLLHCTCGIKRLCGIGILRAAARCPPYLPSINRHLLGARTHQGPITNCLCVCGQRTRTCIYRARASRIFHKPLKNLSPLLCLHARTPTRTLSCADTPAQ